MAEPTRAEIDMEKAKLRSGQGFGVQPRAMPAMSRGSDEPSRAEIDAEKAKLQGKSTEEIVAMLQPGLKAPEPSPGIGSQIMSGIGSIANAIDSYGGAPTRAAVHRMALDSERDTSMIPGPDILPKSIKIMGRGVQAFREQFGEDPSKAASARDIASQDLGLSTQPGLLGMSPAGIAAGGIDVVTDWTNLLPIGWIAKTTAKGVGAGIKTGAKAAYAGARELKGAGSLIQGAERAGTRAGEMIARITSPIQAKDWSELKMTAHELGIDPTSLPAEFEFGARGKITNLEKSLRQGGDSDKWIQGFEAKLNETREAAHDVTNWISHGQTLSAEEAGRLLRESYESGRTKFFSDLATSYDKIGAEYSLHELAPKAREDLLGKLNAQRQKLTGASQDITGSQRAQTRQALQSIAEIEALALSKGVNAAGYPVYNQMVAKLRGIGRTAFPRKNELISNPPNVEVFGQLYKDVREALIDTIRLDTKEGDALANALQLSNKTQTKFFSDTSMLKDIGNPTIPDEKLFRKLIYNGNSQTIGALKDLWSMGKLPVEDFGRIKGAFVNEIFTKAAKSSDEALSFRVAGNLLKSKKAQAEWLLDHEEIDKLSRVVRFGDRFGEMYLNNSGTGAFLSLQNMKEFLLGSASNEAALAVLKKRARAPKGLAPPPPPHPTSLLMPVNRTGFLTEKAGIGAAKVYSSSGDQ